MRLSRSLYRARCSPKAKGREVAVGPEAEVQRQRGHLSRPLCVHQTPQRTGNLGTCPRGVTLYRARLDYHTLPTPSEGGNSSSAKTESLCAFNVCFANFPRGPPGFSMIARLRRDHLDRLDTELIHSTRISNPLKQRVSSEQLAIMDPLEKKSQKKNP